MRPAIFNAYQAEFEKLSASAERLFHAAKSIGIDPTKGGDWRWVGKMVLKGKVKSLEDLGGGSKEFIRVARSRPTLETGEGLGIRGTTRIHRGKKRSTPVHVGRDTPFLTFYKRLFQQLHKDSKAGMGPGRGVRMEKVLDPWEHLVRTTHSHPAGDVGWSVREAWNYGKGLPLKERLKATRRWSSTKTPRLHLRGKNNPVSDMEEMSVRAAKELNLPGLSNKDISEIRRAKEFFDVHAVARHGSPSKVDVRASLNEVGSDRSGGWDGVVDMTTRRSMHYRARPGDKARIRRWVVSQPREELLLP